jgi:hypothetical protein
LHPRLAVPKLGYVYPLPPPHPPGQVINIKGLTSQNRIRFIFTQRFSKKNCYSYASICFGVEKVGNPCSKVVSFLLICYFRTLMNQLLSHLCMIVMMSCLIARPLSILVLISGPFKAGTCDVIMFIGRYLFVGSLGELTLRQVRIFLIQFKLRFSNGDDFF